jgi:hypothetical protein
MKRIVACASLKYGCRDVVGTRTAGPVLGGGGFLLDDRLQYMPIADMRDFTAAAPFIYNHAARAWQGAETARGRLT